MLIRLTSIRQTNICRALISCLCAHSHDGLTAWKCTLENKSLNEYGLLPSNGFCWKRNTEWIVLYSFFIHHIAMKKFTNLFEMKINSGMSYLFWECVEYLHLYNNFFVRVWYRVAEEFSDSSALASAHWNPPPSKSVPQILLPLKLLALKFWTPLDSHPLGTNL